jgi:hypothetical protein
MTIYSPATQQSWCICFRCRFPAEPAAVRYSRGSLMQAVSAPVGKRRLGRAGTHRGSNRDRDGDDGRRCAARRAKVRAGLINARTIQPWTRRCSRASGAFQSASWSWKKRDCLGFACSRRFPLRCPSCACACRTIPFRRRASTTSGNSAADRGTIGEALSEACG